MNNYYLFISISSIALIIGNPVANATTASAMDDIMSIVRPNPRVSFKARINKALDLSLSIDPQDRLPIYNFLLSEDAHPTLSIGELDALKNELLDNLVAQTVVDPDFTDVMFQIYAGNNIVMRDYILQHFATWYPHAGDKQSLILDTLWAATNLEDQIYSTTALLSLLKISSTYNSVNSADIENKALDIANDDTYQDGSRCVSLQIATKAVDSETGKPRRMVEILELAQEWVTNPSMDDKYRLTGINVMSQIGDFEELVVLSQYRNPPVPTAPQETQAESDGMTEETLLSGFVASTLDESIFSLSERIFNNEQ